MTNYRVALAVTGHVAYVGRLAQHGPIPRYPRMIDTRCLLFLRGSTTDRRGYPGAARCRSWVGWARLVAPVVWAAATPRGPTRRSAMQLVCRVSGGHAGPIEMLSTGKNRGGAEGMGILSYRSPLTAHRALCSVANGRAARGRAAAAPAALLAKAAGGAACARRRHGRPHCGRRRRW